MIKVANRLGEVKEYYFSTKLRQIAAMNAEGKDVLNLGIGSPDLPPAPEVVEVLNQAALDDNNHAYQGYRGIAELRVAFADWYARFFDVQLDAESEVLPLIGSKEGLMHIAMTYLQKGDQALVPNPGYPAYAAVTNLTGATVLPYDLNEENDWKPDLKALEAQDLSNVKLMWVNYPNMPSGAVASKGFYQQLVSFAKRNKILLINDNPYAFILNDNPLSMFSVDDAKEVALELNSLSKSHNMAGWRVGMLAGKKTFIQSVLRFKSNMDSGQFRPVQLAAAKALSLGQEWYDQQNAIYTQRRKKVFQLMDLLNCKYDRNQAGMFVWAKMNDSSMDGFEYSNWILEKANVFVTPGGIFGSAGNQYIRISLCSPVAVFETAINRVVVILEPQKMDA